MLDFIVTQMSKVNREKGYTLWAAFWGGHLYCLYYVTTTVGILQYF